MNKNIITAIALPALLLVLQGCAPSSYPVKAPTPSTNNYQQQLSQQTINIADVRERDAGAKFSSGLLNADLMYAGKLLDEVSYLSEFSIQELKARGVDLASNSQGKTQVNIEKLFMRNHRTNGFTPFITFTMLKANVKTEDGIKPLAVYVKRGKVPVWSFDEIIEPTLNEPLALLVKEFSAKLNNLVYKQQVSNDGVDAIISKIKANLTKGETYLDVYELGFSNNPHAIPFLKDLVATNKREYIRLAAISSLGILRDESSIPTLIELSKSAKNWSEKAMAMKAIGDIGSIEAMNFLKNKHAEHAQGDSKADIWNRELIELYIQ